MSKTLVTYISFSGVTEKVAQKLSEITNSDLVEIKPVIPYTDADLDWTNSNSRSSLEMKDINCKPDIEEMNDINAYDIIFIGYPIWWDTFPREINTLIEKYDFSNKTIIPFCTSGGTSITNSVRDLKIILPNSKVLDGKRLSIYDVESFVNELNL